MAYLFKDAKPLEDAPTTGAMLARLDAFCARYAEALERDAEWLSAVCSQAQMHMMRDKAAKVREPFPPKRSRRS